MGRSKDPILSVRLPGDLDAKLTKAAERLDLSKNDIARHAIRAAVAEIEANDFRITLPLEMTVKKGQPVKSSPLGVMAYIDKVLAPADDDSSASAPRFSVKEPPSKKPSGPRSRSARAAEREKGKSGS